jgi:hypothetical protein
VNFYSYIDPEDTFFDMLSRASYLHSSLAHFPNQLPKRDDDETREKQTIATHHKTTT